MKKIFFFLFLLGLFSSKVAYSAAPISPPPDVITSPNGHITLGVYRQFGGALGYYKDDRIPDSSAANGNIIDYSQGGALFTTAIWTLPQTLSERQHCWLNVDVKSKSINAPGKNNESYNHMKVLKIPEWQDTQLTCLPENMDTDDSCYCPNSLPFNNPTQGGFIADGWYGNPNQTLVSIANNKIHVEYRAVNFNYAYNAPNLGAKLPTPENTSEWQTDFWGEVDIYFHPQIPDVAVIETKIIYCKDMNNNCKNKIAVTQDNQLATLFGASNNVYGTQYKGPYGRIAYKDVSGQIIILGPNQGDDLGIFDVSLENWMAILQTDKDYGLGISVQNYQPVGPNKNNQTYGYHTTGWPLISAIQPELNKFENYGITRITSTVNSTDNSIYDDIIRYQFQPGGWYKFKTYTATGSLEKIRADLLQAQQPKTTPVTPTCATNFSVKCVGSTATISWTKPSNTPVSSYTIRLNHEPYDPATGHWFNAAEGDQSLTTNTTSVSPSVDMGANYQYDVQPVTSGGVLGERCPFNIFNCPAPTSTPIPTLTPKPGDLNGDRKVDIFDLRHFLTNFLNSYTIFDYNKIVENFGQ